MGNGKKREGRGLCFATRLVFPTAGVHDPSRCRTPSAPLGTLCQPPPPPPALMRSAFVSSRRRVGRRTPAGSLERIQLRSARPPPPPPCPLWSEFITLLVYRALSPPPPMALLSLFALRPPPPPPLPPGKDAGSTATRVRRGPARPPVRSAAYLCDCACCRCSRRFCRFRASDEVVTE